MSTAPRPEASPAAPALAAIVPAGGLGRRMGGTRKQYMVLDGRPVLLRALEPLLAHPEIGLVVVALPAGDVEDPPAWLADLAPRVRLVAGGAQRSDSVRSALAAVPAECARIVVHDGARPLLPVAVLERTLRAAVGGAAAVAVLPLADTVKEVDDAGRVVATPDRARLRAAQTPQVFPATLLREAHRRAVVDGVTGTDDAALVERIGGTVLAVAGSPENLKITTPEDLLVAAAFLARRAGPELANGLRP
jgi:2-C-methyl-D-erythritol 4-phosphate cytidylyltransferase